MRHLRGKKGEATLYIYGGLTAGSISATEPRYATHIQFDKRLSSKEIGLIFKDIREGNGSPQISQTIPEKQELLVCGWTYKTS